MGTRHLYWIVTGPSFALYGRHSCRAVSCPGTNTPTMAMHTVPSDKPSPRPTLFFILLSSCPLIYFHLPSASCVSPVELPTGKREGVGVEPNHTSVYSHSAVIRPECFIFLFLLLPLFAHACMDHHTLLYRILPVPCY